MINIESLKDYIGNVPKEQFCELCKKIYMIIDFICMDYPKHREWYFTKQLPATINGDERDILFARNPENENEIIFVYISYDHYNDFTPNKLKFYDE